MRQTIEYIHNKFWLCLRGVYPPDSVLAGQDFRQLLEPYSSLEEAQAENPEVEVDLEGTRPETYIPVNPPEWFDPLDAGEVWSEDEY